MNTSLASIFSALENAGHLNIRKISDDDYIVFNELLLNAQSNLKDWRNEPDEGILPRLEQANANGWSIVSEWLMGRIHDDDWNPEWLGWIIYSSQFSTSPWEDLKDALCLAAQWLEQQGQQQDEDSVGSPSRGIQKLNAIIGDCEGEPLLHESLNLVVVMGGKTRSQMERLTAEAKSDVKKNLTINTKELAAKTRQYFQASIAFLQQIASACSRETEFETLKLQRWLSTGCQLIKEYIGPDLQDGIYETSEKDAAAPDGEEKETGMAHLSMDVRNDCRQLLTCREDAIQKLTLAYRYFITCEPLSPIPFLLEKAIRWTGYTLPELLKSELAEDQGTLERFCALLGLSEITEGKESDKTSGRKK